MDRFSVRIQVMMQSGLLMLVFMSVCSFALWVQYDLARKVEMALDVTSQSAAIGRLGETLDAVQIDVLHFANGADDRLLRLQSQWSTLEELRTSVQTALLQTHSVEAMRAELAAEIDVLASGIIALTPQITTLAELDLFGRKVFVDKDILPMLAEASGNLRVVQTDMADMAMALEKRAADYVHRAEWMLVVAVGVSLMIGLVCAYVFGGLLVQPIQRASENVDRLAQDDFDIDSTDLERRDQMGTIARSVDALRGKLEFAKKAAELNSAENERRVELFKALGQSMDALEKGRLTTKMATEDWQDLGEDATRLCNDFNTLVSGLSEIVASLRQSSDTVDQNAQELSSMSAEMSHRAETQAATLEQSAAALEELSDSVRSAASRAEEADTKVVEGRRRAEEGGQVMTQALEAMASIAKSSEKIERIIAVIDDIAFQTNLLALNAGVEAARAGESGKGFAVVAGEVRSLAQRAAESASEIKDLVVNSTEQVADGEKLVQATSDTLERIVDSVTEVSTMVSAISASAKEQASGVEEINVGVAELDRVTQQNAAMVNQTSAASQQMTAEASRLSQLLTRFGGQETVVRPASSVAEPSGFDAELFDRVAPSPAPIALETPDAIEMFDAPSSSPAPATGPDKNDGWEVEKQEVHKQAPAKAYKAAVGDDVEWTDF